MDKDTPDAQNPPVVQHRLRLSERELEILAKALRHYRGGKISEDTKAEIRQLEGRLIDPKRGRRWQ